MKITFVTSYSNAVGQYRVWHPMRALQDLGHECHFLMLDKTPRKVTAAELAGDILVFQRQTSPEIFGLIDMMRSEDRPKVVYEVDDDPWEWHSWDPVHRELGAEYSKRVTEVMSRCDAITCSTRSLAVRIRRKMPKHPIWVIPNAIDYQYRDWQRQEDRAEYGLERMTVLGWTGSIHHERDVDIMLEAMLQILPEYPEVVLLMQSDPAVYGRKTESLGRKGLADQVRWALPVPFDVHPAIYSLFDINLAPLEVTQFNICKSDLHLIEGGAHGVPYVATNVAPYAEFHEESGGIGGYLANTVSEWVEGIEDLLDGERDGRGQSLARYVKSRRSLEVIAGQWQAAYEQILTGDKGEEIPTLQGPPGRNDPCPCGSGLKYKRCHRGVYG